MAVGLIALGSNLGDSTSVLQQAIDALHAPPELSVLQCSRWFPTAPIGGPAGQGEFINAAIRVETSLAPAELHARLRDVETRLGRQRRQRWAARLIDLDLLLFDERVLQTPTLTLPHPRMAFRRFVLEPAAEVGGDMRHPLIGWTVQQLLDHLNQAPEYFAVTGAAGLGKTQLAREAAAATCLELIVDPAAEMLGGAVEEADEAKIIRRRTAAISRAVPAAASLHRSPATSAEPQTEGSSTPGGAISDFWIGQSLVYLQAGEEWDGASCDSCDRLWPLAAETAPPKLLVWLDRGPQESTGDSAVDRWSAPPPAVWPALIEARYRGPLLRLDALQPQRAREELIAAIQAMR